MKVWAIGNQKGGVGKTTTAVTLAGIMAARGHRTLMVIWTRTDHSPRILASIRIGWKTAPIDYLTTAR